jgi:cyanate permease
MVNLISTVAAVAPTLAGMTRDFTGGFVPFFVALSLLMGVLLLTVVMMRPPRKVAA